MTDTAQTSPKARTGVEGLDDILLGGLSPGHVYLLEGNPGTGKTTIALRFLLEGANVGEKGLYITLSESEAELRGGAASHGWALGDGIQVFELLPPESLLDEQHQQSLLYSSDLELGETTKAVFEAIERAQPTRIVLDSLSEIRLLAQSSLRYRRQILAMKHYFAKLGATVLMLDDLTTDTNDKTVHSLAHGVIRLEELAPSYGAERRRVRVIKYRGQSFRGGFHDLIISKGGVQIFPRLVSSEHKTEFTRDVLTSGISQLDELLGGGIEKGSGTLLMGPAGAGKSLLSLQFVVSAITRGEKAALFIFDEELGLLIDRARLLGMDLEALCAQGNLFIEQVDAAELSPGEFTHKVRTSVDQHQVKTVVVDSLNGYQAAMPEEQFLVLHIHELLQYLNRQGVSTFLTLAQHGLVGDMKAPVDITYIADTVILLRYFEAVGEVRRAISVIKKRFGSHQSSIREFRVGKGGIAVGEPLRGFQGILTGVPAFVANDRDQLLKDR
ncbi:MAG TPA: ATPase domain-containing protein [Microvirga sp.]|nr:ATPase domain-containing protein [Microvirga sp.]